MVLVQWSPPALSRHIKTMVVGLAGVIQSIGRQRDANTPSINLASYDNQAFSRRTSKSSISSSKKGIVHIRYPNPKFKNWFEYGGTAACTTTAGPEEIKPVDEIKIWLQNCDQCLFLQPKLSASISKSIFEFRIWMPSTHTPLHCVGHFWI